MDEMQTALSSETSRNKLRALFRMLRNITDDVSFNNFLFPITYKHVILSGTPLNLREMEHFFQENQSFDHTPGIMEFLGICGEEWPWSYRKPRLGLSLSTKAQIPYISGNEQFRSFYKTCISCIVKELWAHWNVNPFARVDQIPLLARSGRALPFEMTAPAPAPAPQELSIDWEWLKETCEQSLRRDVWLFRPLIAASELRTLNVITGWILAYCGDQKSPYKVIEKLQVEVGLIQENDSLQDFDLLDHLMHIYDIRRFVNDVNVLIPFLRLISRIFEESQTNFLQALTIRLYERHWTRDWPLTTSY